MAIRDRHVFNYGADYGCVRQEWFRLANASPLTGEWRDARPAIPGVLLHVFIFGKLYFSVYDGESHEQAGVKKRFGD